MDFGHYVDQLESLYLSSGGSSARPDSLQSSLSFLPKRILIIAPHPDDECLMSGLALRAKQELSSEVWVLPFSFGSRPERQQERQSELEDALQVLGFYRCEARSNGDLNELSHGQILSVLESLHPDGVILPHAEDFHPTHVRCSKAARSAVLQYVGEPFENSGKTVALFETEYWQPMLHPNLLLPLPANIVKTMGEALLKHRGEVARNPYHLTLPAWLMDQERRGSERVHGAGTPSSPPSVFSQLYRFTLITSEASS